MKVFICPHCGNIIEVVRESGAPVMCCGEKMKELVPGTSDGAVEKHVPVVTADGSKVPEKSIEAGTGSKSRICFSRRRSISCYICILQSPRFMESIIAFDRVAEKGLPFLYYKSVFCR